MRRVVALGLLTLVVAAAAAWWWALPPRASDAELRRAIEFAPSFADGAVAIAEPARAARWLARRPQAAILAFASAPRAVPALARLRPVAASVVAGARGPVVLWWKGDHAAVGVRTSPGSRTALAELGSASGLSVAGGAEWLEIATSTDLLASGPLTVAPASTAGSATALARVGTRWWRVKASSRTLDAATDEELPLPAADGTSSVHLADVGALLAPLGFAGVEAGAARLVVDDRHDWGAALPGVRLDGTARRLLGGGASRATTPQSWHGILGEIAVTEGEGTNIASAPALLARLSLPGASGDEGVVYGGHAAWLLAQASSIAKRVPGLTAYSRSLATASTLAEGLKTARFRIDASTGRIVLAW